MPRKELDRLIDESGRAALLEAALDPKKRSKLLRRITARLYSFKKEEKWRAVAALGIIAEGDGLGKDSIDRLVKRYLWALNDESGAVPYGIPEALGEIAAVRPEWRDSLVPILVSCVIHEEMVQTGPILAGALWALGRIGRLNETEAKRMVPGLEQALDDREPSVRASALWTAGRLGLLDTLGGKVRALLPDRARADLLINGTVLEASLGEIAQKVLDGAFSRKDR